MSASGSDSKGPLFDLLFSDILVGRVVQHKQDHREGVIRFPAYQDYTNNLAATLAVCFAGCARHELEEVPADKLSISNSFAEDTTFVPASVLELQRHNWYQPRFMTGLEGLLNVSPPPPSSATNDAQQQPQPQLQSQPTPSPSSAAGVGAANAATGLLKNLRTGASSRKQAAQATSEAAAAAAPPATAAGKQPAIQAQEQLPQAAPPGPPAPTAAPATKQQVAGQKRGSQPAPVQDSPGAPTAAPATKQQVVGQKRGSQPAPEQDSPGVQMWFGEGPDLPPESTGAAGSPQEGHTRNARKRRARSVSELAASEPNMEEWVQGWTGTRFPKSAAYKPGDIPASEVVVEEGTFEVEQILDEYTLHGNKWYLPKWKGYELRPGTGAAGLTSQDPAQKGDWEPEWCIPKAVINRWNRQRQASQSVGDLPAAAARRSRKKK